MTPEALAAAVAEELAAMRAELRRAMASAERAERVAVELAATIDTLCEILRHRGQLGPGHTRLLERVRAQVQLATAPKLQLEVIADKYTLSSPPIDCASRIHLCHGRCCAYAIALSEQDLSEGQLAWRIDEPYLLPHGAEGYCTYQDRSDGGCQVYEHRPGQCRRYDCREDSNIWLDFEAGVPAPLRPGLVPIRPRPPQSR